MKILTTDPPTCIHPDCNNLVKLSSKNKWNQYCSASCRGQHNSSKSRNKAKETSKKNWGVDNPFQHPDVQKKMTDTMLERYGVEYTLESTELKEKRDETMVSLYGDIHALRVPEIQEKKDNTNIERYGDINIWSGTHAAEFSDTKRLTTLERYGVEFSSQSQVAQDNRIKNTLEKYGKSHTSQLHISDIVLSQLEDKIYLEEQYVNKSLIQISQEMGISHSHLHKIFVGHNIKIKRFSVSEFENSVVRYLNSIGIETEISNRTILGNMEIDIYSAKYNIGIECNGVYWHSELHGKDKKYHISKTNKCNEQGIRLIHILDNDWMNKQEIIKSRLKVIFGKIEEKIYARKCIIKQFTIKVNQLMGYQKVD